MQRRSSGDGVIATGLLVLLALVCGCGSPDQPEQTGAPPPPTGEVPPADVEPPAGDGPVELRCPELRDGFVTGVQFSPDGKLLTVARDHFGVILWDLRTHRVKAAFIEKPKVINESAGRTACFSPDGRFLFWSEHWAPHLYDISGGREVKLDLDEQHLSPVAAAFSPDGTGLFALNQDPFGNRRAFVAWDVKSGAQRVGPFPETRIRAAAFCASTGRLATVHGRQGKDEPGSGGEERPRRIVLWESATGKSAGTVVGVPEFTAQRAAFSPDGGLLATGYLPWNEEKPAVSVWDVKSCTRICSLTVSKYENYHLAFSPAGRMLFCSEGTGVKAWNLEDPAHPSPVAMPAGLSPTHGFDISPDGKVLAASAYECVKLWPISPGSPVVGSPVVSPVVGPR